MDVSPAELTLKAALLFFSGWLVFRSVFRFLGLASVRRFERAIVAADADRARRALTQAARWAPHRLGRSGLLNRASLDARLVPSSLPPERVAQFLLEVLGERELPAPLAMVKAHLLRQQDRLAQARELIQDLAPPRLGRLSFYQSRGLFYELAGDLEWAVESYRRSLALLQERKDARGRRLRSTLLRSVAQVLTRLGRYQEAAETLSTSLELDKASAEAVFTRIAQAGLHERLGQHSRALDVLEEGIGLCGTGLDIMHQGLGEIHARARHFQAAELEFDKALRQNPKLLSAYVARSDLELSRDQPEAAWSWLERASELAPTKQAVLLAQARFHEHRGDDASALAYLERAVDAPEGARGPFHELALDAARERLAQCYLRLRRTEDALAEYRRALKGGSISPSLLLSLAFLEASLGEPGADETLERAREGLAERLRHAPTDGALHKALGRLALYDCRPDRAREHFERATTCSPDDFEAWYELGRACRLSGLSEEARKAWTRARELAERPDQSEGVERCLEGGD